MIHSRHLSKVERDTVLSIFSVEHKLQPATIKENVKEISHGKYPQLKDEDTMWFILENDIWCIPYNAIEFNK